MGTFKGTFKGTHSIMSLKIISLGGSIIIPKTGFDVSFLKKFKSLIETRVKKGERFVFVVGGGATCRNYQAAAKKVAGLKNVELDWLGVYTTWFNAEFVRLLFGKYAHREVIKNPSIRPINKLNSQPIIIAGGWKPGWSTDYDAVKLAEIYGAKEVINLSNIDFVYEKDPAKFKNTKKFEKLTWPEMRKIVGDKWIPGKNVPFDPQATKLAQKLGLRVKFIKGTNLKELKKELEGQNGKGTEIR